MASTIATIGLIATTLGGGCAWLMQEPGQAAERPRAVRTSLFAHPWVWTDELGRTVQFARWRGTPIVVTLAFTACRETCPRTIGKLRAIQDRFRRENRAAQFLVVTLDPVNDTPERLRLYKESERLPASWHLLVGTASATRELGRLLDVHVMDVDAHLMHDASIVVFDESGMPARSFGGWNLEDEAPRP